MENEPIIVERTFDNAIIKVWDALVHNDQLQKWYFQLADFIPQAGFKFQFTAGKDDQQYLHLCEITEVIAYRKIVYTWKYDGYPGSSLVSFELAEEGEKTKVKLTHQGTETMEANGADFSRESFTAGWTYIIGTNLRNYLLKQ